MAETGKEEREGPKKGGMEGSFIKDLLASAILYFILCLGIFFNIYLWCVCVCVCVCVCARAYTHATVIMWKPEVRESVLSFHPMS